MAIRLDKFLCDCGMGTRSQVKDMIRSGQVSVNGQRVKEAKMPVDAEHDRIVCGRERCIPCGPAYYMLHKPSGTVCATVDARDITVLSLLKGVREKDLFPVGRLDKDTTGLLLITNDGDLAHRMLSPKRHVDKTYLVALKEPLSQEAVEKLAQGVDIGDDKPTLPAKVSLTGEKGIFLTIREGRFHQVKRMLRAVGNEVLSLKRVSFGPLKLDENLAPGQYRALTKREVEECMKC